MKSDYLKKKKLPDSPGVYIFKKKGKILYIGKATSLRERTKSYFASDLIKTRGVITLGMVTKSDNIKWQETDTVLEALILEANLIKKYKPYHNIKEKDDKSFNFVVITKDAIPKVLTIRGKDLVNHKGTSFGPYTNGFQLKTALQIIRKIFPFIDKDSSKKANIEFYKQIHLTPTNTDEYVRNIKNLKLFLRGKKKEVLRNLKKEMLVLAKSHKFEQADIVKKQIFALQHINDIALLKNHTPNPDFSTFRIEAYDIAHMSGKNMAGVMVVVENGEAVKSEYKRFKIRTQQNTNDTGALKEVLDRRLKHKEWNYPSLIVADGGVAQWNAARSALKEAGVEIPIVSVLKDERHKPKDILGDEIIARKYKSSILLANSEAHRFAIAY